MTANTLDISELISRVSDYILNPLIILMFAVATVVFLWGVVVFIGSSDKPEARETGKKSIIWGLIGMAIMVSVFGIINILLATFDIDPPSELSLYQREVDDISIGLENRL